MVWDSQKERLLVAMRGTHPLAGHMLLYTTVQHPVLSAVCLGPVYLPQPPAPSAAEPSRGFQWLGAAPRGAPGGLGGGGARRGIGARGSVALQCGSAHGTLLAARCSEELIAIIPLAVQDIAARSGAGRMHGVDSRTGSTTTLF
jgi:hypothetical protein